MNLKICATSMLWSIASLARLTCRTTRSELRSCPFKGIDLQSVLESLDFIPAEAPDEVRIRLSALAQLLPQAAGRVRRGAKLGVLRPRD